MKRNQIIRIISIIMVLVLSICTFSGCGKSKSSKGADSDSSFSDDKGKAKGRYVEKKIEIPFKEDEKGVNIISKKDGGYRLYTYLSGEKIYKVYESSDGQSFTEGDAQWLNRVIGNTDCYLKSIFQGDDGEDYALFYKDGKDYLISGKADSDSSQLFSEVLEKIGGIEMLKILENGDLVTSDVIRGKLEVWSAAGQSCIKSMDQGTASISGIKMFDENNGKAIVLSKNNSGFTLFDLETGRAENEISYNNLAGDNFGVLKLGKEDDCIYLDRKGFHHVNKNGSTVETIMEGDTASMGDLSMDIVDFAIGENSDFFALYNFEGKGNLFHYIYDENAKVVPEEQLVIFGLEENRTIKQAVSKFQQSHPDVKINYKTGNAQETTTTRADQIRVLNTELLGGNGADILVLDGLPLDSYIEKGVLEDLNGFYEEIKKDNPLQENIVNSMKRNKGLYQLPVRTKVLCMFGSDEETSAMQSLDSLEAYLEGGSGSNLVGEASYEYYIRLLLTLNYENLFIKDKNNVCDEKELEKLLKIVNKLGQQTGTKSYTVKDYYLSRLSGMTEDNLIQEMGGTDFLYSVDSNNDLKARKGKQAVIKEAEGPVSLIETCEVLKELNTSPQGIHGLYIPNGMVGINSNSKNKEMAREFLKLLFSEEIQNTDLNDGFPVNEKAVESWSKKEVSENGSGLSIASSGEDGEMFSADEPSGEQLMPFIQISREANVPVLLDDVILEVIIDEGIAYCKGEKSIDEAISAITGKTKTYMAE